MYIKGLVERLLEQERKLFLIEIKRIMALLKEDNGSVEKGV